MPGYKWKPIEPLTERERLIDLAEIGPLYESWRESKKLLEQESSQRLREFSKRLVRRLSIETGILERIYDVDRGTTEALVAQGFVEDLVARTATDIQPGHLVDILRDQEAAIQLVTDGVAQSRQLTKGFIHELHSTLTRHQESTVAQSPDGKRFEIRLLRGQFKQHPNNPQRSDGSVHEYCPPVHVDAEIDNLLGWLESYQDDDPIIVASWFHHRFTQIHPYQDGNGRLARTLITLILLRAELLPLVVDRDIRSDYIGALEEADSGDLEKLTRLLAGLERKAILEALSIDIAADIEQQRTLTGALIESLAAKFDRRKATQNAALRKVNDVARELRFRAFQQVSEGIKGLKAAVSKLGLPADAHVDEGGPDHGNEYYYRHEVVETARKAGKFANLREDHWFVKASMRAGHDRLVFVVSFHHIGRELSGIMEATAFTLIESIGDLEEAPAAAREFIPCSIEPFVFTHRTVVDGVHASFARWLDTALAIGLKEFGDRL